MDHAADVGIGVDLRDLGGEGGDLRVAVGDVADHGDRLRGGSVRAMAVAIGEGDGNGDQRGGEAGGGEVANHAATVGTANGDEVARV